jgi:hypothetical protein
MSAPHKVHFEVTKHVLCYMKRTQEFGIFNEVGIAMAPTNLLMLIGRETMRNGNQQHVTYFN